MTTYIQDPRFYSGECYANHRYRVGVARAEQLRGPYVKCGAPVLSSGRGWAGLGHCVVCDHGEGDAAGALGVVCATENA